MKPSLHSVEIALGELTFTVDTAGPADGEPVLMLHGFPQSRYTWRHQIKVLADAGFRVFAPDQRGYSKGARPATTESYAVEKLLGDALGIMDAVGAPRFHLVGHDWGGQLAWMLALREPQRVASLTVLSRPHPAAFAESLKKDAEQAARSGHHSSLLKDGVAQNLRNSGFEPFRKMFKHQFVPDDVASHYLSTLNEPGAIEAAIDWYRAGASSFRNSTAGKVTMPTLYLWGNADATVGRYAAMATGKFVDAAFRLVEIDGAGHFLTDQVPERISALLLEHVLQNPLTRS